MRKSKKEDGGNKGANWMDTYGDMVTLLLTFFVLLYSFSTVDANKWRHLVSALNGSAGVLEQEEHVFQREPNDNNVLEPDSMDTSSTDALEDGGYDSYLTEQQNVQTLYESIKEYIEINGLDQDIIVNKNNLEILVRFSNNVLFASGEAVMGESAETILSEIANMMEPCYQMIKMIRIEGHTDNVPISTSKFPTNWELSTARAVCVLRYMITTHGFPKDKISAVGYGEEHPVADNNSEGGRKMNRRVDFVISVKK